MLIAADVRDSLAHAFLFVPRSIGYNRLNEDAALSIVRVERQRNKLTTLGLASSGIRPSGAKEIAEWISATTTITSLE